MRKISIFMLAGLLVFTLFICGCDGSDDKVDIIDNKIEASDLFGDFDDDTESAAETEAANDSETATETAE